MGIPVLDQGSFPELRQFGVGFDASTPLWYYVLKEGQVLGDGITLAGVGARIIGEVFVGLLQLDPASYLAAQPNWRPTLPAKSAGNFTMVDLLSYAKVDPASRRQ
jgi:hypothetical protein